MARLAGPWPGFHRPRESPSWVAGTAFGLAGRESAVNGRNRQTTSRRCNAEARRGSERVMSDKPGWPAWRAKSRSGLASPSSFQAKIHAISAAVCAFSLTSLVAQRDAGDRGWTLRAAVSSCALVVWAAAAGSAMAFPGMAAYRVPDRWMTQGWCPSPARNPDRGHRRHPDRPGQDSRRSPSAR